MMVNPQKRYSELKEKLRSDGYRLTPQRVALLRLLSASDEHPQASVLHKQIKDKFPTTSLATVYKTLRVLQELEEVLELGFSDDDNRYDGRRPYPHPHLVCVRCRKISDLGMDLLQDVEQEVTQLSDYEIVGHRLDVYGICPDCQAKEHDG